MPRNPDPTHPMHDAAAAIAADLPEATPPGDPVPEVTDLPTPGPTSTPALPTGDPPQPHAPEPSPEDRFEQFKRTMEGRFEAINTRNRELEQTVSTLSQNREFTERTLNEQKHALEEAIKRARTAEAERDAIVAGREFKSELVDQDTFTEIYRGINPHLQRLQEQLAQVTARLEQSDQRFAGIDAEIERRVAKERKAITERLLLRDEPDFQRLMERADFKEFLAEAIPGSRGRTRAQELMDAYNEGDTRYMAQVAADFRKRGAPTPVGGLPTDAPRAVGSPMPRAPVKEEQITEEHLQAAHEKVLRGDMSEADYRKLSSRFKAQQGLKVAS